jgi:protein tyrosine phosphatase (PTP) superfamily phosphohydrolase (DUF442 family)
MRNRLLAGLVVAILLPGCQPANTPPAPSNRALPEAERIEADGLHNVLRLSERLYSGSSPDGEPGFRSLRRLGVRTIVTVDGARPDVETARKYGMRYVHLPIGYDGVPRDRALEIARAIRDLPGPVYVHCHHGKHRGPAAAVAAEMCLDDQCSAEQGEAILKLAGTDPKYLGLIGVPRSLVRPTSDELNRAATDFPEVTPISDLARLMVEIDGRFDNLQLIRKADWRVPKDHPDLDPPHEALQLAEQFREAARLSNREEDLTRRLRDAEAPARPLEAALRSGSDATATEKAFAEVRAECASCHAKYRDVPKR